LQATPATWDAFTQMGAAIRAVKVIDDAKAAS
jgi:hypothetical protein